MNPSTNSQVRFQLNLIKTIKSALLGLASLAVLFTAISYSQPAAAARRAYVNTNGNCLRVRTSPSLYAPVAGCLSNGSRLRVVRYQNNFARLRNGTFVYSPWISSTRPSWNGYRRNNGLGVGGPVILSYGSTGSAVSAVQRRLGVSSGTGYFGSATRDAVINFQLRNGLTADGVVGPVTRRYMGF
jgi:peptidoglycan hydrolase-like protein with peptidoglycan-binding domain